MSKRYSRENAAPTKKSDGAATMNEEHRGAAGGERSADDASEYTVEEAQNVMTNLDPQLQDVILSVRSGQGADPALVQAADDGALVVDVLAVLRDPQKPVPGLDVVRVIGDVATGTVEVGNIESVRADANVLSLKGARKVNPNLQFSVPEIRATQTDLRDALPPGTGPINGSGVIVGVVDFGCDFAHQNFRNPDGTTRILFLWDQARQQNSMSPAGFPYGREFSASKINAALQAPNPYAALMYDPGARAHGTHVMDIAAGNGRGTGAPGVAPKADLIFVQLSSGDFGSEESFGNSRRLLEAVDYIFSKARELGRPAVVNLSLGTHGGPHDGSTPAERGFDALLKTPGRAIVISAGNSWQRRSHARGRIGQNQSRTLRWEEFVGDTTANELEVWYGGAGKLDVTVVLPGGQRIGPTSLGKTTLIKRQGVEVGRIIHREKDSLNGDNQINVLLGESLPSGRWGVELRAVGTSAVDFHAWIERDDDRPGLPGTIPNQSKFITEDDDRSFTVGSISCGKDTIVVGSYNAAVNERDISGFTSEGPTRDGKRKPEVSAPGDQIVAAASRSGSGTTVMSGTSMAAPHVTGLVALLMQAAGKQLSTAQIREAVINSARNNPPAGGEWHPRYGEGRVDAVTTVLTQIAPIPTLLPEMAPSRIAAMAEGNGHPVSINQLLASLVDRAGNSKVRVQLEIEVEPLTKQGVVSSI